LAIAAPRDKIELSAPVNAFRHAATKVENWMQPAQHPRWRPREARVEYIPSA